MDQHSTAHVFPFGIDGSSETVYRPPQTQAIEQMHVPVQTAWVHTVQDAQSCLHVPLVRLHLAAVRGAQKAIIITS